MMKRTIFNMTLTALLLLLPTAAMGYDFTVDGIFYNINEDGNSVSVTYETNDYRSYSGDVVIPNVVTHEGTTYSVTAIGPYAFRYCINMTHVTMPGTVTDIGDFAFGNCTALTSIKIPESVRHIGVQAFYMCTKVTSITIPDSVTTIDNYAFSSCWALDTLTIGKSLTTVGGGVFYETSHVKTLIYNARRCPMTVIGQPYQVENVVIGDEVEMIPDNFIKGSQVTYVDLPSSVTSIGSYAFSGCN